MTENTSVTSIKDMLMQEYDKRKAASVRLNYAYADGERPVVGRIHELDKPERKFTYGEWAKNQTEAVEQLRLLQTDDGDPEYEHIEADKILCNLLNALGYDLVVSEYLKVTRWYS